MEPSILLWNRLEPSLRNENQLDNALRFEIADALWMLTRQWQFGEFEAEDAGTAAFVQMKGQYATANSVESFTGKSTPFNFDETPYEQAFEASEFIPEIVDRIEMGRHWQRLIRKRITASKRNQVWQSFLSNTRFHFTTGIPEQPDRIHKFQHAQKHSDEQKNQLLVMIADGKAMDGYALLHELKQGKSASAFLSAPDQEVDEVGKEFLAWYNRVYGQVAAAADNWHSAHLEYQAKINFHDSTGPAYSLNREEYYGEGVDWFGFDANTRAGAGDGVKPMPVLHEKVETVLPAGVRFRGMPAARLWEMEDSQVDFGSIRANSTELSKMLFAEFGLVYGNDWLVAPISFPLGSICRLSGLAVTDNFGKTTSITEIPPNAQWSFFQSRLQRNEASWLFLSGSSELIQEDKPVEKVVFLRDEMANLVWGVEELLTNPYGGGRDGNKLAKFTSELVASLRTQSDDSEGKDAGSGWKYKAGTLMAENRIPLIAVLVEQAESSKFERRSVVLQRAATPRVNDDFEPVRIRPRTSLLGYNGGAEDEKPHPFFIFEEEIPRAGIELSKLWKRTRWFNGTTRVWLARRKSVGVGDIDANFRFDTLTK